MKLLLVAATELEIAALLKALGPEQAGGHDAHSKKYRSGTLELEVLITGVGMTATAYRLGRALAKDNYDAAINLGICGSFEEEIAAGEVVHVCSDCMPELGAEDGDHFLDIQALGLLGADEFPFVNGRLVNLRPPPFVEELNLRRVNAITVNTVHGRDASIETIRTRCRPETESMEGAAFFYACLSAGMPCAQLRAVSNRVERRNRESWKIGEALKNLNELAIQLLEKLK